jgi:endonuclease/exonuclease/phosphatase family metal-dependent hydrolase
MHGAALLKRWPIARFDAVSLPEFVDKFHAIEKRLGSKRALLAEVLLPDGPLTVAHVHLDPFSPPVHRARQMRIVLDAVDRFGGDRVLVGGDFNTNTYHLGSKPGLAIDIFHKLVRFGFEGTVEQYMTPDAFFERALFEELRRGGYETRGYTDPSCGTIHYDLNDPEVADKSRQYIPGFAYRWLERRLRRWGGCVPMRLDHFAGRGLQPLAARTIDRPRHDGVRVSDHNPIVVELALGG